MGKEKTGKCNCKSRNHGRDGDPVLARRRVAKAGMRAMASLPSARDCAALGDRALTAFVDNVRHFAIEATQAASWDDSELESFDRAIALASSIGDVLIDAEEDNVAGRQSCTFGCLAESRSCSSACVGAADDTVCAIDCRLAFLCCLADCIMSTNSSSSGPRAISTGGGAAAS